MKKLFAIIALSLAIAFLLGGCASHSSPKDDIETPIYPQEVEERQRQSYTLYFGSRFQPYLDSEVRTISLSSGKRLETQLIEELIKGPSSESSNLSSLIPVGTEVVSVVDSNDYLFVTLSSDFLNLPIGISEDWSNDENLRREVYLQRRLATYSIINTITELGTYSRVQLLIDTSDNNTGVRPTNGTLGFYTDDSVKSLQMVEPFSRNDSIILTPVTALEIIFSAMLEGNWESIEPFISQKDVSGNNRPSSRELVSTLTMLNPVPTNYKIISQTCSPDGRSAVIVVDYDMILSTQTYSDTNISLRMLREDGIWKLSYSSLIKVLRYESN